MERHHSVDSDHDDQPKLMKILRRLSETAAMDRDMHVYPIGRIWVQREYSEKSEINDWFSLIV